MARAASDQAKQTFKAGQGVQKQGSGLFDTSTGNANGIFSTLLPQYEQEALNPQGFGGPGLAAMNTAAQQSTGGATAGAVGQGTLMAARTRNLGSAQSGNNAAAENAQRVNSQRAVEIQGENERLKQEQAREGRAGEAGLYDTNLRTALGALGAENSSLGEENQATKNMIDAQNSGWFQNMLGTINALSNAAKGASSLGVHV